MKGYTSKGRGGSDSGKLKHKPGYYCPKGSGPALPSGWAGKWTDHNSPYQGKK